MTTIPYDEGWKVYVDGEQVDIQAVYGESLMAFYIENAGDHEIEFKYMPDIYVKAGIISIASSVVFIGLIVFECVRNKKRARAIAECENKETTEGEN